MADIATLDPAVKSALDEIKGNFTRIHDLENRIKSLDEVQQGTADLKQEVANLSIANAKAVDTVKAFNDRLDQSEVKMQERLERIGGRSSTKSIGEQFTESDAFKASRASGQSESAPFDAGSFLKAVTLTSNATPAQYIGEFIRPQDARMGMRDLVPGGQTSQNSVAFVRVSTRATAAAAVAAGGSKPESSLAVENVDAPVRKLAHYIAVNDEQLADTPALRSMIDAELLYGLKLVEDAQILNGSGSGQNLNGIVTQATAYAAATYGTTVASAQRLDHLRGMIAQLQVANYVPDGVVLNPLTWFQIETVKESTGAYMFANPTAQAAPRVWGLPVVVTTQIAADNALVGAFQIGAQIFDRMQSLIKVGWINDQFVKNQLSIICEERLALAVKRPGAFVYGDLTPA